MMLATSCARAMGPVVMARSLLITGLVLTVAEGVVVRSQPFALLLSVSVFIVAPAW